MNFEKLQFTFYFIFYIINSAAFSVCGTSVNLVWPSHSLLRSLVISCDVRCDCYIMNELWSFSSWMWCRSGCCRQASVLKSSTLHCLYSILRCTPCIIVFLLCVFWVIIFFSSFHFQFFFFKSFSSLRFISYSMSIHNVSVVLWLCAYRLLCVGGVKVLL